MRACVPSLGGGVTLLGRGGEGLAWGRPGQEASAADAVAGLAHDLSWAWIRLGRLRRRPPWSCRPRWS